MQLSNLGTMQIHFSASIRVLSTNESDMCMGLIIGIARNFLKSSPLRHDGENILQIIQINTVKLWCDATSFRLAPCLADFQALLLFRHGLEVGS